MIQYRQLLQRVLSAGEKRPDRTGTGTLSLFGESMRFSLAENFPLVTGKYTNFTASLDELLWMISGSTNINDLNSHIWDEWADEMGELGPVYGKQWRAWDTWAGGSIDQLDELVKGIKKDPTSRRHILSSWNVADLQFMALPPCHCFAQFYIRENRWIDSQVYVRSNDLFLGAPFDISAYALLTMMLGQVTGYRAGEMNYVIGDAHIYLNHIQQVNEYLSLPMYNLPFVVLNTAVTDLFKFTKDDVWLVDYKHGPRIKAKVSV